MCNNRETIIERIKKLLALANDNQNEHECIAAALKAQKLIAEYNIEDHELNKVREPETIETMQSEQYVGRSWRYILANIVAENFRCQAYTQMKEKDNPNLKGEAKIQCFVGYKSDATAALLIYNKLVEVAEECARVQCRKAKQIYGTARGVKNTMLLGFCAGVKTELEKQSQALMIVVPQAVIKYVQNELNLETCDPLYLEDTELDYTEEGRKAGRDAVRASRIEGGNESYLVSEGNTHLLTA